MKAPVRLEVARFASSGEGVGRLDGAWVGVPGAIPGERVTVRREGKRVVLCSVDEASPDRVAPRCPVVDRCGGCAWQHVAPARQMEARVELLRRALPPSLREVPVEDRVLFLKAVRQVRAEGRAVVWLEETLEADVRAALEPVFGAVAEAK